MNPPFAKAKVGRVFSKTLEATDLGVGGTKRVFGVEKF